MSQMCSNPAIYAASYVSPLRYAKLCFLPHLLAEKNGELVFIYHIIHLASYIISSTIGFILKSKAKN